jgi:hypothetical protein
MDELLNSKSESQQRQDQEKTDKIQDFLNKQFSEITLKAQERQNSMKTEGFAPSSNLGVQNLFGGAM